MDDDPYEGKDLAQTLAYVFAHPGTHAIYCALVAFFFWFAGFVLVLLFGGSMFGGFAGVLSAIGGIFWFGAFVKPYFDQHLFDSAQSDFH